MPTPGIRTCTACGTRNNPKWEFCVRCGEALEPEGVVELGEETEEPEEPPRPASGFPWRSLLLLAGAVALVVVAFTVETVEKPSGAFVQVPVAAAERVQLPPRQPDRAAKLREGHGWLSQGKPAEALGPLAEAVAEDPENPEAHMAYARALWGTDARDQALASFETAARLGGKRYRTEYGNVLVQMQRTEQAREVLEGSIAENPDDLKALEILGRLHNREGRPAEAVAILSRATTLKPDDPQLLAHLGYALERTGNPERAAEVLAGVVARVPTSTVARELLAEAEFKQGKREEAVTLLRQGLERKPDSPDLHRRLGSLLERAGRAAEAATAYREYLRLAPNASDAGAVADKAARLERTTSS
jgi:Flp pilus assembly protein TadD